MMVQKHWHAGEWTSESVQDNQGIFQAGWLSDLFPNTKVENKEMVLSLVEQAKVDKENWQIKKSGGKKKSPSCESTNQTTQTKNCPIKITIETKVQKYVGICISCWI